MNTDIANREMGIVPISIATSLAFEGLYNRHPELKPASVIPASKAKIIYINARTLFRNIHGAIGDNDKALKIPAKDYANCLLEEMDEISTFLKQEAHPIQAILYLPSYKSLAKYMGNGELKPLNTDKQKQFSKLENDCLQEIFNQYKDTENKPFIDVDMDLRVSEYQDIFILTHYPMDLLNILNAGEIYLLESHTGVLKSRDKWYTKFSVNNRHETIPFNKGMLLFFGDSAGIFKPQNIKARDALLDVSKKRKWNAYTTKDRVLLGLELSTEPYLSKTVRELFK